MMHTMSLMNLHSPMTSLALPCPKTMIVLGICISSPVCCNKRLLIYIYIYIYIDLILAKYLQDIDI
jgi:hypothetical protein